MNFSTESSSHQNNNDNLEVGGVCEEVGLGGGGLLSYTEFAI